LSCYLGVEGLNNGVVSYTVGPNTNAGNSACVSYCFVCQEGDTSGCTVGQTYRNYAVVTSASVAQMKASSTVYQNLVSCSTDNCNDPAVAPLGCGAAAVPPPSPPASGLSCFVGSKGLQNVGAYAAGPDTTRDNAACVSYCFVCQKGDQSGCTVGQTYQNFAVVTSDSVAQMKAATTIYKNFKSCNTDNCNDPNSTPSCPAPTTGLSCFVGVKGIDAVVPYAAGPKTTAANAACVSYCFTCQRGDKLHPRCRLGTSYQSFAVVAKSAVNQMKAAKSVYKNFKSCNTKNCNDPKRAPRC
jgi:hypothetical protein